MSDNRPWCVLLLDGVHDDSAMRTQLTRVGNRIKAGDRVLEWDGTYTARGEARYRERPAARET